MTRTFAPGEVSRHTAAVHRSEAEARRVRWFSCGSASAVATKLDLDDHPGGVVAYCATGAEDADNERFLLDCERWFGVPVIRLQNPDFADTWSVWEKRRYMSGIAGAPCTSELKISPRIAFQEPSAGRGALARLAHRAGGVVTCVEIQRGNADELSRKGYPDVICADFFDHSPETLGQFDRVVMNPPFDGGRDIDHVVHALAFVKPGGRLVSVMSAGVEFREDRKTADFRALVERYGGSFRDLPPGSFAESGTMVNTCIVSIEVRA